MPGVLDAKLSFGVGRDAELQCKVDFAGRVECNVPISPEAPKTAADGKETQQPSAFGLPCATVEPVKVGGWTGSVAAGSSVNVDRICMCVHGNGTHAECVGHVLRERVALSDVGWRGGFLLGSLITVTPTRFRETDESYSDKSEPSDWVLTRASIESALKTLRHRPGRSSADALTRLDPTWTQEAIFVRTINPSGLDAGEAAPLPVGSARRRHAWTGTNPPYFSREAAELLGSHPRLRAICVDLPSVDREDDGGRLITHRAVFGLGGASAGERDRGRARLVTESCYFPDSVPDGIYVCDLQLAAIRNTDAVPANPVLFPIESARLVFGLLGFAKMERALEEGKTGVDTGSSTTETGNQTGGSSG